MNLSAAFVASKFRWVLQQVRGGRCLAAVNLRRELAYGQLFLRREVVCEG